MRYKAGKSMLTSRYPSPRAAAGKGIQFAGSLFLCIFRMLGHAAISRKTRIDRYLPIGCDAKTASIPNSFISWMSAQMLWQMILHSTSLTIATAVLLRT